MREVDAMRKMATPVGLLALLALAVGVGCDGPTPHTLEITFGAGVDRAAAVAVEVRVIRGTCAERADEVYRSTVTRSEAGMELPDLERGPYAVLVAATDGGCRVVADACVDVELPVDGASITVELSPRDGPDRCSDGLCVEGVCMSAPLDAGIDAAMPRDAGADSGTPLDAGADAGTDGGPLPPAAPVVVAPWNGVATGSARSPEEATLVNHPLRPRVVWEASDGAQSYVVEMVACTESDRTRCDFSTPLVRILTDASTLEARPDSVLPVETTTAPLGGRIVFRVGACALPAAMRCSFSPPRYIDVGRVRQDVDGDGIGDLFGVVRPSTGDTELRRYDSLATGGRGTVALTLAELRSITWIGDYDGDGIGELAVVTGAGTAARVRFLDGLADAGSTAADAGTLVRAGDVDADGFADFAYVVGDAVRVQLGGAVWDGARSIDIRPPSGVIEHALAIAPAGDRDGDGNADLAVASRIAADMVRVDVYSLATRVPRRVGTSPTMSTGEAGVAMGVPISMTGGYDMDGDGRPDLAVGRHFIDTLTVLFADGMRADASGFQWRLYSSVSMGLLDGTDRARVAVGAREGTDTFGNTGGVYHVAYTGDPFAITRIRLFNTERFGAQNATADLTGNGREDMVNLAGTGGMMHVGLFTTTGVGGTANFLFAPSGGSITAISR